MTDQIQEVLIFILDHIEMKNVTEAFTGNLRTPSSVDPSLRITAIVFNPIYEHTGKTH